MLPSPDDIHRIGSNVVMLRSGLNMIQQALSIYSSDLRLVFANQRFRAMFDLPAELSAPGAAFSDTIRLLALRGEYGRIADIDQFVTDLVERALTFEQHYVERKRANGRWISVEGGPLRQGGWVTVYTDITDIKRQEEMLRSRSDELSDRLLDRSEELARTNRALEGTISRLHETQQHLEAAEARIRLAAETTPAHIARVDREERYTYSNQKLPLNASRAADDLVGFTAREVLGPQVYAEIAPALRSALSGQPKVVEFNAPEDGRRIRAAFTPDTGTGGTVTGVYVLSMDITDQQALTMALPGDQMTRQAARFGRWTARFDLFELQPDDGRPATPLTKSEAALLRVFLTTPNQLLSREGLLADPSLKTDGTRALDLRVSRLRQKLGDQSKAQGLIRTIYGAGYLLVSEVEWL